ncbi:MAG: GNAT family N-acetyltransferase [Haliea sp.]
MTIEDYEDVVQLWSEMEGVKLRDADSKEGIDKYLLRNPGLSFVATDSGNVIGTIMAGHDGKRGYIQHLAVADQFRREGVATKLVSLCLDSLKAEGILKSHVMILSSNKLAKRFWSSLGWEPRSDIELYSFINGTSQNT